MRSLPSAAEDIFSSHSAFSPSSAQTNKGWINRLLETNRVPIIWVSNDVDCLDPAFLRRFDLKLHFDYLLPEQSLRLLNSHCRALELTPPTREDIRSLGNLQTATPGDFANVALLPPPPNRIMVRRCPGQAEQNKLRPRLRWLLGSALTA